MTQENHKNLVQKADEVVKQEKIDDGEFESLDTCKAVRMLYFECLFVARKLIVVSIPYNFQC